MKKDFNEFLSTLTEDKLLEITDKINSVENKISFSTTPEGINKFVSIISAVNLQFTIEVVRLYHEWLNS
ncbi:hypothetical protein [Clostridium paraputrificum]|uniref:hypothetical protein n=1 Tax=Clostridium paraputrificum TaxID=29363 RepID=UPI00040612B6|nr:hypothetical protein [Clostridium paraputrificum]MDB2125793.1 hypothetical protein [Clostridium paraputrificum]